MAKYRVKPGMTFGAERQYKEGAIVTLTPEEAKGFLDKLIPLGKEAAAPQKPPLKNDLDIKIDPGDKFLQDEGMEEAGEESNTGDIDLAAEAEAAGTEKPKRKTTRKAK